MMKRCDIERWHSTVRPHLCQQPDVGHLGGRKNTLKLTPNLWGHVYAVRPYGEFSTVKISNHTVVSTFFKLLILIFSPKWNISSRSTTLGKRIFSVLMNVPEFKFFCESHLTSTPKCQTKKREFGWFEYIRNGTIDLLAFLDVHIGKVNVECKPDHTKETFLSVFEKHLASVPRDERIDYIMDNLACHYSYELCQLVAKFSDISCPDEKSELKLEEQRRQWLQSEDKRIVIHFTPFHGSWLNMIEIWFGILGTKCLKESYASPDELVHAIYSMAEIWNTKFAHPFKSKYNGVGLHEKVVKRFIKFLYRSSEKLHIKFLTKQLLLMSNMIEQYWDKVSINQWQQLFDLLYEKEQHLWHCIDKDDKPKRKKKACAALKKLFVDLSNSLSQEDKAAA